MIGTCQYCQKPFTKGLKMHERYCKENPNNIIKLQSQGQDATTKSLSQNSSDSAMSPVDESHIDQVNAPVNTHKNQSWLSRVLHRKPKPKIIEVDAPEDLISGLPAYKIPDSNPKTGMFGRISNRNKDFIQVVLVSEIIEPKTFWAEKTGMNRIQYKDRMYVLPRDIRGNVFFWHIDLKVPLVDVAQANESDAETSFHELQLFNMAYSVGRAAGANDLLNNLKLILLGIGFLVVLSIGIVGYLYQTNKGINNDAETIINMLNVINQSVQR